MDPRLGPTSFFGAAFDQPPWHPSQLQGSSQHHPALPALLHLPGLPIRTRPATNPVTSPAVEQQPIMYRHKPHNLTIDEVWAAEELAAKLASADGQGKDAAGNAARLELLDTWLEPDYAVGMGLTMDRFAPDLTADPVAWWRRYGSKLPHLHLSIPATSAATERLFSAFKFIWSDRRSLLLLGRMWIMSYVFFNTRVMTRKEHHASAEAQEEWESFMATQVVLDAPQL
ncbi:dimer_Tnp_hAT domain-containing protein [Haematococcus lacustris]|uniref:Dimer_Tnp_hAT domain-containing protein n=1 Tax=Haematococcus lacustris TaxID=44745 RepID=A0A699ZCI9_HAELA|nr:dimer_Tnp_hAT domain-containing protein [Haematococcus lacustris]